MLWTIIAILISYILGSIPTAYIFGLWLKGIDIRKFGSGNVGATNALRVLGKGAGIAVLALDILKGFLAVFFLGNVLAVNTALVSEATGRLILALSCICGHNWTIFLKFKGGKGIATTLGALIALAVKIGPLRQVLGLVVIIWLLVFLWFRIVSLASMMAAIALPIFAWVFQLTPIFLLACIILSTFVLLRHKTNLIRILQGKEKPIF